MNGTNIKETINQVNIPEDMQKEIIRNLQKQEDLGKYKYNYKSHTFKRTLLSAAALLLIMGTISIPVQAGIRYLVKARMESIPAEEMEATLEMMQTQTVGADSFSREYSQNEKQRRAELFTAYQNGTFPHGQLLLIESEDQIPDNTLCYLKSTSCFYLPDRELTDEEILEIIEFNYKREYSLSLDPEVQAVMEEREKEQNEIKEKVQADNGITEAEAVTIAQNWMNSFFNVSPNGMEETIYLDDEMFEVPIYHITYDIQSTCYYYFSISTIDGSIMSIDISLASWGDAPEITEEQATAQMSENYQTALRFLNEQLEIRDEFETVYCLYRAEDGKLISRVLSYFFQKADGDFYLVTFRCGNSEFSNYTHATAEWFKQLSERENAVLITLSPEN